MEEKFWHLKNCPLFEMLSAEQVQKLESVSQSRKFSRGDMVYMPADASESVFLLTTGRIKLYHITPDGKQALLALIEPGEIFGELAVFDESGREEFAEAMAKSLVIKIPRSAIQSLMQVHPNVALGVTKLMGFRRKRVERRLKSLLFRSNRERLIHLLIELATQYGVRTPQGVRLRIKLSHQELASIIGSTRETVTVVLGDLQTEGNIQFDRRHIILCRPEQMAKSVDAVFQESIEAATRPDSPQRAANYGA